LKRRYIHFQYATLRLKFWIPGPGHTPKFHIFNPRLVEISYICVCYFKNKIHVNIAYSMMFAGGVSPPYGGCDSPGGASCDDRSPLMSQPSPTSYNDPFLGTAIYSSDSEASPNPHQVLNCQNLIQF